MEKYLIPLETPCVYYDETFLTAGEADAAYADLHTNTKWEKTAKINRWVSLVTDSGEDGDANYKYRDAPGAAIVGFSDTIRTIKERAEAWYNERQDDSKPPVAFNVCLLNFYENGDQRIGWHSDREEVGRNTPIASVSLGATRQFLVRSKEHGVRDRASMELSNGSLTVMENICQLDYLHSIPKQKHVVTGRINLTFRCKNNDASTAGEDEHERRDKWLENITDGIEAASSNTGAWSAASKVGSGGSNNVFGDGVRLNDVTEEDGPIKYLVKTNLGAEGYCAAEIKELIPTHNVIARPLGMDGFVAICGEEEPTEEGVPSIVSTLLTLKSAHHLESYHDHFNLSEVVNDDFLHPQLVDGETLYAFFKKRLEEGVVSISSLAELNENGGTFRVTCDRIGGPHAFRAPDVEREIGGAMMEFYSKCIPKMADYDLNVRVDVVGNVFVVGTQINIHDLSKERHFLRFRNAVTIKTNLAYAMVRCANISVGDLVIDPFCGSGTLLLEALEMFEKRIKCFGMDVSKRTVAGARENALAENCGPDVCDFICTDARGLRRHMGDNSVDAIVTNLPWGVMTGHKNVSDLQTMYEVFLRTSWYVLKPGARIVMLVLRGLQVTRIVRKLSGRYRIVSVNVVRTTNNLPCIVVIEKLPADELRDSVKGQLAYMAKYVNVSPEMYEAIHMEAIDES